MPRGRGPSPAWDGAGGPGAHYLLAGKKEKVPGFLWSLTYVFHKGVSNFSVVRQTVSKFLPCQTLTMTPLLLKDTPEQKREGQHMGQRSSSEEDSMGALGHLAMFFFFPDNLSSSQQKEAKETGNTTGNQKLYLMSWAVAQVLSYK